MLRDLLTSMDNPEATISKPSTKDDLTISQDPVNLPGPLIV
jgi:hypothetical protein